VQCCLVLIALALICLCSAAVAQEKLLTIDDIYDPAKKVNFNGSPPLGLRWLKGGTHYLQVSRAGGTVQLLKVNALTGESAPFFDAAKMEAALAKLPGLTAEDAKHMSHQDLYEMNAAQTAVLLNRANDLFYYEFGSETAIRLTNAKDEELDEGFSPDGRLLSFVRNNNLHVVDVATRQERQLTFDGSAKIINGHLDWVYQEEMYGRGNFKAH
jgi:dipeptidyl-peptidase-4